MFSSIIYIFLFFFIPFTNEINIIANSALESCLNTGSNSSIECKQKIVLTLTINNGELSGADEIVTYLKGIEDKNGNGYTTNPYKITIEKSDVYVNYPCIYLQDFNYNPKDLTVKVPRFDCVDGDLEEKPTCGFKYDEEGNKIQDSQGFCCTCPMKSIFTGSTSTSIRGGECNFLDFASSAFAHCLIYSDQWFSAYEIIQYEYSYTINVFIENMNDPNENYTLTLSPTNTISISEDRKILIKNVGDFLPLNPPLSLSGYFLVAPSKPTTTTIYAIQPSNWMLIRREMFTLDGTECDKIGVGYKAFRNQNNKCEVEAGSCLNNQIIDYFNSDIQRIKKGETTKYLISGDFSKKYKFYSGNKNGKMFGYKINGQLNSVLTLELDAEKLNLRTNVADGEIISAFVNEFESLTKNGKLFLNITNKSDIKANFQISFKCNNNIKDIQSEQFTLDAFSNKIFNITIYTLEDQQEENHCNITLKNSIGVIIDESYVAFNTSSTKKYTEQNEGTKKGNSTLFSIFNSEQCSSNCNEYFQFNCFLTYSCWGYLIRDCIISLIVCIIILFILLTFYKKCCRCRCCKSNDAESTTLLKVSN